MNALKAYLEETRRPIYSAVLVLPFVVTYQLGVWILKSQTINGGDFLIRSLLSRLSVNTAFASVLVLLVCFIVWQVRTKASWKVEPEKLGLMLFESILLAEVLFHLNGWFSMHLPRERALLGAMPSGAGHGGFVDFVLYCGAGIYEELVFRVLLLSLLMLVCTKLMQMEKVQAAVWSVIVGALLFSLFHYIGSEGEKFGLNSFLQRTFAGLYFAALYVTRSFGVAAAAHALYDVRVGLTLAGG
jgi:hypothetical protein